jgi:hypothetical protein
MSQYMLNELEKINKLIEEEKKYEDNISGQDLMNRTVQQMIMTKNSLNKTGTIAAGNITGKSKDFHGKIR